MLVDSNKQKLSSLQVLARNMAMTEPDTPLNDALSRLKIEMALPKTWKMQEGNTVYVVHRTKFPGYGYFKIYNIDTIKNFIHNNIEFLDAAYKVGFDVIVTQFTDPNLLKITQMTFKQIHDPDMGYVVKKTNHGGYEVTIQLGHIRGGK